MKAKAYLLSVPERLFRSVVGLGAGVTREVGEVALPKGVRETQLYQNLVDTTLRFLIERVGSVEGAYADAAATLPDDFFARRTTGNAIELLGIVAFRASPVWVLAALADVVGAGRRLIPEIAGALKAEGLLDKDAEFTSADQMLEGLERTSARLAATVNTPPLDVATLRSELQAIRHEARAMQPESLPSVATVEHVWMELKDEAARQGQSVFATSSMMAVAAVRGMPDGVRWLSASAVVGAKRTGEIAAAALLDHYRTTLGEIRTTGFAAYTSTQMRPYLRAAAGHFSPARRTFTERWLERRR